MGATGSIQVNFGATPGATDAVVTVTGQAGILATSKCEAWVDATLQAGASANHNADEHSVLAGTLGITVQNIVPGTGFDIHAVSNGGAVVGLVDLLWVWL
jgi:hypothetical protein